MSRRAHFLRPNHATRYPRRIVCLDTESHIEAVQGSEWHSFRVGCWSFDEIDNATLEPFRSFTGTSHSPEQFWADIAGLARSKAQLAVFALNVGYDVRISKALEVLPALGWTLTQYSIDGRHMWLRFAGPSGRSIVIRDLFSFVPASLETIGDALGMAKAPLPEQGAPLVDWVNRCQVDVQITRRAVLDVLQWLERSDMGTFRLTGAAQSQAAYRHRFMGSHRLLVHEDYEALALEREAAFTGRCEVWRHGEFRSKLTEWDFRAAYARIGLDCELPVELQARWAHPSVALVLAHTENGKRTLSRCTVTTEVPVVPCRHEGRICWPVGTFDTLLWDNELRLALDAGATVDLGETLVYRADAALAEWARWILNVLEGELELPALMRLMVKSWSRALIGRFALSFPLWRRWATAPHSSLEWVPFVDEDGSEGVLLHVGHDVFEKVGTVEPEQTIPAITSFVTAEARCRLWHVMIVAGLENVVYCDTDSVIVTPVGSKRLQAAEIDGLRVKAVYREARVLGPRALVLESRPRVSGMPKNSRRKRRDEYDGETWETLVGSIQSGRPANVVVSRRSFRLRESDKRRKHLGNGATEAYRVG
jgi:hypothetical protein